MLNATDTTDTTRRRYDSIECECALTDLEGLAIALKIVRFGEHVLSHLSESDHHFAVGTMIDAVTNQVGKLSEAIRGEPFGSLVTCPPKEDDGEGDDDAVEQAWARHDAQMREAAEERRRVKDAEDTAIKMAAILPNIDVTRMGADLRRGLIGALQGLLKDIASAEQAERARCDRAESAARREDV